jgi:hypothetical protein
MKANETKQEVMKPNKEVVGTVERPKSKTTLFWEKFPNGILEIVDMRAVLR